MRNWTFLRIGGLVILVVMLGFFVFKFSLLLFLFLSMSLML